jgi:hypothetical protein
MQYVPPTSQETYTRLLGVTSQETTIQTVFVANPNRLMLFTEIIDVCYENQTNTLQGQNVNILILNQVAHTVNKMRFKV